MNRIIKRSLVFLTLCFFTTGCNGSGAASMKKSLEIRGQRYQIPAQYILSDLPAAMIPRGPGMDEDDSVVLEIPLQDLGIRPLPHDRSTVFANAVQILLYGPSAFTSTNEHGLNPEAWSAWTGTGHYHSRMIVKDAKTGLFRVYWRDGGKSWEYFVESPPAPAPAPVHGVVPKWVAGCRLWGRGEEAEDMSNVICDVDFSVKQGDADISFSGRYLSQTAIIVEGVKKKVGEWASGRKQTSRE